MTGEGDSTRPDPEPPTSHGGAPPRRSSAGAEPGRKEGTAKRWHGHRGSKAEPDVTERPFTPIPVSRRARNVLLLAVLAVLAYVVYLVPDVLTTTIGGIALALVLSFPVRFLKRFVPRGFAILLSFLLLVGLVLLAALFLVPIIAEQFASLVGSVPYIVGVAEQYLSDALNLLQDRGLLSSDPAEAASRVRDDLTNAARSIAGDVLGGVFGFVYGTFSFALTLFGVVFVGAYLLADVRRIQATYLRTAPHAYRRDARTLWDAFGFSLGRYLSGLAFVLFIQGLVSALGLWMLGVPYPLVLGAWVSITAVIPYLGAFLGGIPAVLVALTVSPTTALLTVLLFLAIQQLEGNFLTPKIQGDALHVHPILVFLAVIIGGGLAGIAGVIVAVPALAVLRIIFDFFRVRLCTDD